MTNPITEQERERIATDIGELFLRLGRSRHFLTERQRMTLAEIARTVADRLDFGACERVRVDEPLSRLLRGR